MGEVGEEAENQKEGGGAEGLDPDAGGTLIPQKGTKGSVNGERLMGGRGRSAGIKLLRTAARRKHMVRGGHSQDSP